MSGLTVQAYKLSGEAVKLTLRKAEVSASADSPATSLSAEFFRDDFPGELAEIEVRRGEDFIFRGRVDKQSTSMGKDGAVIRVDARSRGALLLDNEALPRFYMNVGIQTIFSQHIEPYGFYLEGAEKLLRKKLPDYTVTKGQSQWEAFTGWTNRALGLTPHVRGMVVSLKERKPNSLLTISNRGGGVPFTELSVNFIPYNMISKIYLRDGMGAYSSYVGNPTAKRLGVDRTRYMIPPDEFTEKAVQDANRRIERANGQAWQASVTIPEIVDPELGQNVILREPGFENYALYLCKWTLRTGPEGDYTELSLQSGLGR